MIIDAHTHIGKLPDSIFARMSYGGILKYLLKEMKSSRTAKSIVLADLQTYPKQGIFSPKTDLLLDLLRNIKNLYVVGTIDALDTKSGELSHLEDLLKKKKIFGIKLYPAYKHFYPNDKICSPVYKLCQKYDVPAILHMGDTLTVPGRPPAKIKYSHPIYIDDVAAEFPDLKIIIAHMGNPWLMDCAEVLYKNKNVYADISGLVVEDADLNSPYGALMRKRIQELCIYSDTRKLLYGTDWPLASMKTYIKFTKSLGIPRQDLDYVFYKNAVELFKL